MQGCFVKGTPCREPAPKCFLQALWRQLLRVSLHVASVKYSPNSLCRSYDAFSTPLYLPHCWGGTSLPTRVGELREDNTQYLSTRLLTPPGAVECLIWLWVWEGKRGRHTPAPFSSLLFSSCHEHGFCSAPPGAWWGVVHPVQHCWLGKSLILRFSFRIPTCPQIWATFTSISSVSKRTSVWLFHSFHLLSYFSTGTEPGRKQGCYVLGVMLNSKIHSPEGQKSSVSSYSFFTPPLQKPWGIINPKASHARKQFSVAISSAAAWGHCWSVAPLCAKGEAGPDPHTGPRSAPRQAAQSPGDELPRVPQGGLPTWPPSTLSSTRARCWPPLGRLLPQEHFLQTGSSIRPFQARLPSSAPRPAPGLGGFSLLSKHRRLLFSLFFSFCIIAIFALFLTLCARLVSAKWKLK